MILGRDSGAGKRAKLNAGWIMTNFRRIFFLPGHYDLGSYNVALTMLTGWQPCYAIHMADAR